MRPRACQHYANTKDGSLLFALRSSSFVLGLRARARTINISYGSREFIMRTRARAREPIPCGLYVRAPEVGDAGARRVARLFSGGGGGEICAPAARLMRAVAVALSHASVGAPTGLERR